MMTINPILRGSRLRRISFQLQFVLVFENPTVIIESGARSVKYARRLCKISVNEPYPRTGFQTRLILAVLESMLRFPLPSSRPILGADIESRKLQIRVVLFTRISARISSSTLKGNKYNTSLIKFL